MKDFHAAGSIAQYLLSSWNDNKDRRSFRLGIYTLVFGVTYLVAFHPFWINRVSYVLSFDGRDQTYPWLAYMGIWVRRVIENFSHGNFTLPLYDLSIGWGDGSVSYMASNGLLDPILLLLSGLIPTESTELLYNFLPIVYMYLSGLAFLCLCSFYGKEYVPSLIGALIYVFNGFTVYYALAFVYAVNFMVFLPFLIVGVEKIIRGEKSAGFTITVFLSVVFGTYYRLYILTFIVGVYAVVRMVLAYPRAQWLHVWPRIIMRGIGSYILGVGLSAVFLFPALAVFFSSTRTESMSFAISTDFAVHWKYFWARFLSLIAPKTEYEWDWGLDYPAYAAIFFPAVIVLFTSKGRKTLKWLTAIALIMLFCPVFGWVLNGFQYVCNRWSFALALLAGYIVAEVFPELLTMSKKQYCICAAFLALYSIVAFMFASMRAMIFGAVGAAFLTMMLLLLCNTSHALTGKKLLCLTLVMLNVSVNTIYFCSPESMNWSSWFVPIGDPTLSAAGSVEGDAYLYPDGDAVYDGRFDSTLLRYNDSMFYGIPGTAFYTSTINSNISDFRKQLEMCGNVQDFKSFSTDQRTIANTLLSVKYQLEKERNSAAVPFGYEPIGYTLMGGTAYINHYALPWGYTYDRTVPYDSIADLNGVEKQEVLLQAAAVDEGAATSTVDMIQFSSRQIDYSVSCADCTWENGILKTRDVDAAIILSADLAAGKEYYIRLKGFHIDGFGGDVLTTSLNASFDVYAVCGDVFKHGRAMSEEYPWYYGREDYLFCLGYSEQDRNAVQVIIPAVGEFRLEDIELYALPLEQYPEMVEKLRAEPLRDISVVDNTVSGSVDLSGDKLLCLTIPYDKGWTAYVDGKEQDILRVNYAFLGLELPAGHHEITFSYFTPGLKAGFYTSLTSLCMIALTAASSRIKRRSAGSEARVR